MARERGKASTPTTSSLCQTSCFVHMASLNPGRLCDVDLTNSRLAMMGDGLPKVAQVAKPGHELVLTSRAHVCCLVTYRHVPDAALLTFDLPLGSG